MPVAPDRILALSRVFLAEEVGSYLRHGLRNKLAAIRNAAFYLRKKVESTDPRIGQMMQIIDTELASTEAFLQSRLAPPDAEARCDPGVVGRALCAEIEGVKIEPPEPAGQMVCAATAELELALWSL